MADATNPFAAAAGSGGVSAPSPKKKVRRKRKDAPPVATGMSADPVVKHGPSKAGQKFNKNHPVSGQGNGGGQGGKGGSDEFDAYDLNQPRTPEQVKQEIDALIKLQYATQTQGLRQQAQNVGNYFDDYRSRLKAIRGQMVGPVGSNQLGGLYGAGIASVGALGQQLGNAGAQAITASQMPGGLTQQALNEAAAAAQIRQQMLGNVGGLIAGQGVAEAAYLANRAASSGALEIQAQTAADKSLQQLKGEKGAARVKALADIRAEAQQAKVDQAAIQLAGIKELNDVRDDRRDARLERLKAKLDRQEAAADDKADRNQWRNEPTKWGPTTGQWAKMSPAERKPYIDDYEDDGGSSGGSDKDGLTPSQIRDARQKSRTAASEIDDITSRLGDYIGADVPEFNDAENPGKQTGTHVASETEVRNRLKEEGFSSQQIDLAMTIRTGSPLSKQQKAIARRLGITRIPKRWRQGRPVEGVKGY